MTLILGMIVLVELGLLMGGLRLLGRSGWVHPEGLRKLLHVAMGVTVLSFPWLFEENWPVLTLAGLATVGMLAMRTLPVLKRSVGTVISGVGRTSFGDVYFPVAVGLLWLLSGGDKLLFGVPVLVLALADATAALIGVRYGSVHYQTFDGRKSAEGSLTFFIVTFLCVHIPVLLMAETGRVESLLLGVTIGLLVMLVESISWRGLDNLLVPLGTWLFLDIYLDAPAEALAWRVVGVIALVGFTLIWRRRSSMDDSALIAGSLFGYATIMLGGWTWLLPPLMLFLVHSILWPRTKTPPMHTIGAVFAVTGLGMVCLLLYTAYHWHGWWWAYTASFAAHLANVGVSYMLYEKPKTQGRRTARLLIAGALAWGLVVLPVGSACCEGLTAVGAGAIFITILVTTYLSAMLFYVLMPWMYGGQRSPYRVHGTGFGLALFAVVLTAVMYAWAIHS